MKRPIIKIIVSLSLSCLLLFSVLTVSCVAADTNAVYEDFSEHVLKKAPEGRIIQLAPMDGTPVYAYVLEETVDGVKKQVTYLAALESVDSPTSRVDVRLWEDADHTIRVTYREKSNPAGNWDMTAEIPISLHEHTGHELVQFEKVENIPVNIQVDCRIWATNLLNTALAALEDYAKINLDLTTEQLGFTALHGTTDQPETEPTDAFSETVRTVLLVVAIASIVCMIILLVSIRRSLRRIANAPDGEETETAPTPAPAAAPSVPAGDDPAVIAAITAAIAATIAADETLSEQFAGGFRVVSFRKTSTHTGSGTAWNR